VEIVVLLEDVGVGQEMHLGAALVGRAGHAHGRDLHAPHLLEQAVLHHAARKLQRMHLAVAAHRQVQPFGQRVHARDAHAVQAARDLVAVLVELAARVQLGERDLGGAAPGLVLVVHLHPGRDAAPVVGHADRVVAVDGHDDVVAMPGQRLVDGVVDHLEHQVVQTGAVRGVTDVHARALAHRFQPFKDLDGVAAVVARGGRGQGVGLGQLGIAHGVFWYRFKRQTRHRGSGGCRGPRPAAFGGLPGKPAGVRCASASPRT